MRIITSPAAAAYIEAHGGGVWVWLDPHRGAVGHYVYLEAHTEPPRSSRKTSFSRSSRRPHSFRSIDHAGIAVHYDWGRLDDPDDLEFDLRGVVNKRLEAYWNGCVFADSPTMLVNPM
jgi:hypothetical protein